MEDKEKKDGRGGRREGAGRPKTTIKRYGFCATEEISNILESMENKTDFILQAILEKWERDKN